MRLIDADALKVSVPDTSADIFENCRNCKTLMDWEVKELIDQQPTASPWHRVEDGLPPKATWVLTVAKDGDALVYSIATVDAGGTWWTIAPQSLLREQNGVRYWMPIEPPKEDA